VYATNDFSFVNISVCLSFVLSVTDLDFKLYVNLHLCPLTDQFGLEDLYLIHAPRPLWSRIEGNWALRRDPTPALILAQQCLEINQDTGAVHHDIADVLTQTLISIPGIIHGRYQDDLEGKQGLWLGQTCEIEQVYKDELSNEQNIPKI